MTKRKSSQGFAALELVLIVVIIAALAAAGWWVYKKQNKNTATNSTSSSATSQTAQNIPSAPPVNSASDLDKALQAVNQSDPSTVNASDTSQLDSQASSF